MFFYPGKSLLNVVVLFRNLGAGSRDIET